MGKKFTLSLLVLAATLLALPIKAQHAFVAKKALPSKVMKGIHGQELKKAYTFKSEDLKAVTAHAKLTAEQKAEIDRAELKKLWADNLTRVQIAKASKTVAANAMVKKQALSGLKTSNGREFVPVKMAQKNLKASGVAAARLAAPKATRRIAAVDELTGDFMLASEHYDYDNGFVSTLPEAGATPITIAKVDDTTISITGFTAYATNAITATVDVATSTISIENGQTLTDTQYGPIILENALNDNPITATINADGSIDFGTLWYDVVGGDGQYAGYQYSGIFYYSFVAPVNGTMTWVDNKGVSKNVNVYIEQVDPKTATIYNFGGYETAIDVTLKSDSTFVIANQLVTSTSNGDFYTYGINEAGTSLLALTGTGTEQALAFDTYWTLYASTGYWFGLQSPATISLAEGYKFDYPVIADVAATPAVPEILEVGAYNAAKGYGYVIADIPTTDANGNDILESKLSYQFYSEVNGEVKPIVLPAAAYESLDEDITVIPYLLNDAFDFDETDGYKLVFLNFEFDYDRIGVKSIYTGGGETHETEIQWYTLKLPVIETLPYLNALNTEELFNEFTVLDVNADGKTWAFNADNKAAAYTYSGTNAADDWLISRPIKLEKGKSYRIALDARSSGYDERFEVKLGTAASPAALTTTVIGATDVTESTYATYANDMVTVAETGEYYVGIHAISDADMFRLLVTNFIVEAGLDPAAPAAVTDFNVVATENKLEATVSFKAPTLTAAGNPLESLEKIDIYRDGKVIASLTDYNPGDAVQYVDADDALTMGTHVYQVIAYNAVGAGVKSEEKSVFLSIIVPVPATFDLSDKSVFDLFQVINANEDAKTWAWNSSYGGAYYQYNSSEAADDYLISSPVAFEAGKNYKITVVANCANAKYPEAFRVLIGKEATVAGLNTLVADTTWVETTEFEDFESEFTATESGAFYVAVQAVSPANMWRLNVTKIIVDKGADPKAPAVVDEFKVMAGLSGAQWAMVSFTAPAKALDGSNLTENLSVNILRGDSLIATLNDVVPGVFTSYKDEDAQEGFNTYQVVASNSYGVGKKSDKVKVYVGIDTPANLQNLIATDNVTSVDFTWDKVGRVGVNGGYVNTAAVDYEVWSLKLVESIFGYSLDYDELKASVTDTDNYSLAENTEEGVQDYKYWAVQPVNEAGVGSPAVASMLVGASYELPVVEGFAGSAFHYIWEYSDNAGIFVSDESTDDDDVALKLVAMDEPGTVTFTSGKVSLKNVANPTLLFDVKSATISKINVIGSVAGAEFTTIKADAPVTSEYTTVKVPLNDLKNARFVQLGFSADFASPTVEDIDYEAMQYVYEWGDILNVDNIRIVDLYEHDVEVALDAPASVVAGKAAKLNLKISNNAENAANGFTLKLSANDKEFSSKTFDAALKPFSSIDVAAEYPTTVFDEAGDVTIKAEVVYNNDLNLDNNVDETVITVKEPTAAAPVDLVAQQANDSTVTLTWNVPSASTAETTEDFDNEETFVPFSLGGITETEHTGAFGDWTLYDGNGIHVYGFNGATFENSNEVQAWQVFNPALAGESFAKAYAAHSGAQFLWSFCPADQDESGNNITPAADHWLISPELPGDAQTISFFAKQISSIDPTAESFYGYETFEVLASSTDNKPASFTKVKDGQISSADWAEFTADLPAGTKFFAIRHTSTDIFGLLVDDITYVTGGSAPVSFNIYVDQAAVANTAETTADIKSLASGSYVFAVTAVYANGAESKPVTATIDVVNAINEILNSGKSFTIYTVDGKLINREANSLKGLKGAYIINNKKVVLK